MSREKFKPKFNLNSNLNLLRPFVSISIVVMALFSVAFVKMEARRMGYEVLKKSRAEKLLKDHKRELDIGFAKLTRPARIEKLATQKLDLKKPVKGRIIQFYLTDASSSSVISRVP